MNFLTIADVITDVRLRIERKIVDGHICTVSDNPTTEFLKHLCILIPNDLSSSPNVFWIPPLRRLNVWCQSKTVEEYFAVRLSDITDMTHRLLLWYDEHIPETTSDNEHDIAYLLELKQWFKNMQDTAVMAKQNSRDITLSSGSGNMCGGDVSICSTTNCGELCCGCAYYCCSGCVRAVVETEKAHWQHKGVADAIGGSEYSGGTAGYFTGEAHGYYAATSHELCYSACSHTFGKQCANNVCCCYQCDRGNAAAMEGGGGRVPENCCGAFAYQLASSQESFRRCYCSACACDACRVDKCGECTGELVRGCCHGLGKVCGAFYGVWMDWLKWLVSGFADVCGPMLAALQRVECKDCDCFNCDCSGCDCPGLSCDDSCGKFCTGLVGFFTMLGGILYDALTHNSSSSSTNRRALAETTPEYTVSIVLMCITMFLLLPRLVAVVAYASINVAQGIAKDRSRKCLLIVFCIGFPVGYMVSALGGASTWTYFSIILVSMFSAYKLVSRHVKKIHPALMDTSTLSSEEWRVFHRQVGCLTDCTALDAMVSQLKIHKSWFKDEIARLCERGSCVKCSRFVWSSVPRVVARANLSQRILSSHTPPASVIASDIPTAKPVGEGATLDLTEADGAGVFPMTPMDRHDEAI